MLLLIQIRIGFDTIRLFEDNLVLVVSNSLLSAHRPRGFQNVPLDINRHAGR